MPWMPASAMVRILGTAGKRLALVIASAFTLSAFDQLLAAGDIEGEVRLAADHGRYSEGAEPPCRNVGSP